MKYARKIVKSCTVLLVMPFLLIGFTSCDNRTTVETTIDTYSCILKLEGATDYLEEDLSQLSGVIQVSTIAEASIMIVIYDHHSTTGISIQKVVEQGCNCKVSIIENNPINIESEPDFEIEEELNPSVSV